MVRLVPYWRRGPPPPFCFAFFLPHRDCRTKSAGPQPLFPVFPEQRLDVKVVICYFHSPYLGPTTRQPTENMSSPPPFDERICTLSNCCKLPYCFRIVRDYNLWLLKVHPNQGFLGRCVLICKRADALDLAEATEAEREELFAILRDFRRVALDKAGPLCADWMNYAFLGNDFRHLHAHIVPRYAAPVQFAGETFTDKLWGRHYETDKEWGSAWGEARTREVVCAVRDALSASLQAAASGGGAAQ